MAGNAYDIATDGVAVHDKVLTPNQADTVTITDEWDQLEVLSDGTAALYFSTDGTPAAISGSHCYKIPAGGISSAVVEAAPEDRSTVSIISAGATTYSVTRAQ